MDYNEHNRKALPANRAKFNPTEERYVKGYIPIKGEDMSCREVDAGNVTG